MIDTTYPRGMHLYCSFCDEQTQIARKGELPTGWQLLQHVNPHGALTQHVYCPDCNRNSVEQTSCQS